MPEGKSSIVSTDTADVIEFLMPQLMEVFMRSGEPVKFLPQHPDDFDKAHAATCLVNSIFTAQNNGWAVLHDFVKDALLFKCGVIKAYYDTEVSYTTESYEGVTDLDLAALTADADVEIVTTTPANAEDPPLFEQFDVEVRRAKRVSKICVENVPPENFLFSSHATSVQDAEFLAERSYMTMGELLAQGYDREDIEPRLGLGEGYDEQETQVRHRQIDGGATHSYAAREGEMVRVVEAFMRLDLHETGIPTMHRVLAIGQDNFVLDVQPMKRAPFVVASPIRVPHRLVGRSIAEMVADVQKVKSVALRGVLDNLYLHNDQRMVVVEGRVQIEDVLSSHSGGIIRLTRRAWFSRCRLRKSGRRGWPCLIIWTTCGTPEQAFQNMRWVLTRTRCNPRPRRRSTPRFKAVRRKC